MEDLFTRNVMIADNTPGGKRTKVRTETKIYSEFVANASCDPRCYFPSDIPKSIRDRFHVHPVKLQHRKLFDTKEKMESNDWVVVGEEEKTSESHKPITAPRRFGMTMSGEEFKINGTPIRRYQEYQSDVKMYKLLMREWVGRGKPNNFYDVLAKDGFRHILVYK